MCQKITDKTKIALLGKHDVNATGGAERHFVELARNITSKYANSKIYSGNNLGIKNGICFPGYPGLPMTINSFQITRQMEKTLRSDKPDIVHAQMTGAPYGLVAARVAKDFPTVLTVHSMIYHDMKRRGFSAAASFHDVIWYLLEMYELKTIENIILVSGSQKKLIPNSNGKRIHIIPNGLSDEWYGPRQETREDNLITWVGRIEPVKGLENLIEAVARINGKRAGTKRIHLNLVGPANDAAYTKRLGELIKKRGIQDDVIFVGEKRGGELIEFYDRGSLFVLPSYSEACPIVLIEAMARGMPVIATNVGDIPDMIDDGMNGSVVKPGDVDALEGAIENCLFSTPLLERYSDRSRELALKYRWSEIIKRIEEVYSDMMR